ncbi:hypothetical protein OG788_46235 [Streptomyces sp. NBC_00647]|uniref:hypothetical protein n=1 Tax=Streptomyces sp. NBC_00647 TaxID=2975796 RepID=UPI0032551135
MEAETGSGGGVVSEARIVPDIDDLVRRFPRIGKMWPQFEEELAAFSACPPLTRPGTLQILLAAAPSAGLTAVKVGAVWRAASGFAHGRYWPNLRASQPYAAFPADNGIHTLALVIDEDQHRPLAQYCNSMLRRLQEHYTVRAQAH